MKQFNRGFARGNVLDGLFFVGEPLLTAIVEAVHLIGPDDDNTVVVTDDQVARIDGNATALYRHINAAAKPLVRTVWYHMAAINNDV